MKADRESGLAIVGLITARKEGQQQEFEITGYWNGRGPEKLTAGRVKGSSLLELVRNLRHQTEGVIIIRLKPPDHAEFSRVREGVANWPFDDLKDLEVHEIPRPLTQK